jgi:hypothetical protein
MHLPLTFSFTSTPTNLPLSPFHGNCFVKCTNCLHMTNTKSGHHHTSACSVLLGRIDCSLSFSFPWPGIRAILLHQELLYLGLLCWLLFIFLTSGPGLSPQPASLFT